MIVLARRLQVYAVDLSPVPLSYAAFNAQRLGVADRLTTLQVGQVPACYGGQCCRFSGP